MKPSSVVLAAVAIVAAVFAWSVHRRNAEILAEAELWAVAGADTEATRASSPDSAPGSTPTPLDSRAAGTPADAMPDGPAAI